MMRSYTVTTSLLSGHYRAKRARRWTNGAIIRDIALFLIALVAVFWFIKPEPVQAGKLTNIGYTISDKTKGAKSTHTITFTNETEIPATGGRINVLFRGPTGNFYGYDVSVNFSTSSIDTTNTTPASTLALNTASYNWLVLSASKAIPAGSTIKIVLKDVTNPKIGGYYIPQIYTTNYSGALDGSSTFGGDYIGPAVEIGTNSNLIGKITDDTGAGVSMATVTMNNANWSNSYNTYTDKDGNYGLGDVPADNYTFRINYPTGRSNPLFPPSEKTVAVAASGVTTANASFIAATKTLSGKVTKDDGTAVTNATVYVYRNNGMGWYSTAVDSTGSFSYKLPGGTWTLGIYATTYPADWVADTYSYTVTFNDDSTSESKSQNFAVTSASSIITGTFQYPNGTTISNEWAVGLSASNSKNQYFSAKFDKAGKFTLNVTEGTYTFNGWVSDSQYSFPKMANLSIGKGETKDLGIIKLAEKSETISGKVTDESGAGVSGAYISAWRSSGGQYDYGYATSGSDGSYTIKVVGGTYSVSAYPSYGTGYVYSGKPESVTVSGGVVATKNFTFQKATNTLTVNLTDPDGNNLSTVNAWVSAGDGSQEWGNVGGSINNGVGTLKLPKGTWTVRAYLYQSEFSSPDPVKVTFAGDNESQTLSLKAPRNQSTIKGTVYDENGNKITGKYMSIYATKGKNGSWFSGLFDQTNGTYSMKVSAGTYRLGWWIDQSLGYSSGVGQDVEIVVGEKEEKTYDIKLLKASAKITGKATKSNGEALQWAWITADSRDPNEKKTSDSYFFSNGASSNNEGNYTMNVPPGTYFVGGNMWYGSGVINPTRQKVDVKADETATVNLVFREADATITGTVKKDGNPINAYITGWSEDGAAAETTANNQGSYSVSVSKGSRWHLRAIYQEGKQIFKSGEMIVDMSDKTTATADFELKKQSYDLPSAQVVTFDPTQEQAISLDDGTTITIPAQAMASEGKVTLTITPDANLAEDPDAKPLFYGYDFNVVDQNGKNIEKFKSNITIEFKYLESALTENKITDAGELIVGYRDQAAGTWQELNSCTVNTNEKTVTCQTDHFTRFAVIAATDTTPPSAPTGTSATATEKGIALAWTNPKESDFKQVVIYRSTTLGEKGEKLVAVEGTSYEDTNGLEKDKLYFYTLKAADKTGNESINVDQVSTKATVSIAVATTAANGGGVLPKTGAPLNRSIQVGLTLALLGSLVGLIRHFRLSPIGSSRQNINK